jgi:hypothetical protein
MKVRMKVAISGQRNGVEWPPVGSVIDLPDDEAAGYCAAGMAEPVTTFAEAEKAVMPEPEKRGPVRPKKQAGDG